MTNSAQQIRFDKITFICQITEDSLSLARCTGNENARRIADLSVLPLAPSTGDNEISARLRQALKDFGYRNGSFILCVPRSQATCRYLKIPAYLPHEIEKIISLQASTYLPYPAHELIIGYQVISVDKEGYSYLNIVIVHKSVIERYLHMVREAGAEKIAVVLSSYGLVSLYNRLGHHDSGSVLLITCDSRQAELAVVGHKKLLFSRHVRLDGYPHDWEQELVTQVRQTREAYAEEVHGAVLHKVVILGKAQDQECFFETLARESVLPVEII
jgi:Tfp pilus assembly PilM family ATPase